MKGLFIVFEGIDGSGKTTQLNLLANWLKLKTSYSVECTREPGGSAIGTKIRQLILENSEINFTTELLLFAAKDYSFEYIKAGRCINSDGKKRAKVTEVLISNF